MATISEFINKIGFKVKNEDVNKVNSTMSDMKETASKILGAIGIGFSLASINGLVEEFTRVKDQVKNSTAGLGEQVAIQEKILAAASATRSEYSQTAGMVSNLVKENSELFGTIDEAIKFNNAATMLFKTAGKTNEDIAGLMEAINKSFAKGKVDSETMSQLLERSPEAVALLNQRLGTTTDQLEQMASDGKISLEDLKGAFVDNADAIEAAFGNVKMSVTDAITVIRNKWGLWLADTNEMLGLTDTIGRTMVSAFDGVMRVITKVRTGLMWLAEKLGGTQNLLKLIAIVAGSIFLAMNFTKIISGLQMIGKFLTSINLKTLAIIAVIILVALLVEDFINFLMGNNSIFGELLEQAGVDVEAVREAIFKAWEAIKKFLKATWETIKNVAKTVWNAIKDFFAKHGDSIKAGLTKAWQAIKTVLTTVWSAIKTVATTVFNGLKNFWEKHGDSIKTSFSQIWNGIKDLLKKTWDTIKSVATNVFNGLRDFWNTWGSTIKTYFAAVWEYVKTVFSAALDVLAAVFAVFGAAFSGDWKALWEAVKNLISTVWNAIKSVVSSALDGIKSVLTSVWNVISSATSSTWNSIKSAISGVINSIASAISSVFNNIKSTISGAWNSVKSTTSSIWNSIKSAISDAINGAWSVVSGVVNKLKSAFNFSWSLPKLKLPHITVTGGVAPYGIGGKGSLPKFSISWYKKGGILDGATIFGAMGNQLLGGGEAGKEAVLPLSELWKNMKSIMKTGLNDLVKIIKPMVGMDTVSSTTVSSVTNSSVNKSIVQNINFKNEFHGERAAQQKAASTMKQAANDTTAELARALAFTG